MRAFARAVSGFASSSGANGRLQVLLYHRVHPVADPLRPGDVDVERFEWQMEVVARYFTPLAVDEALTLLNSGKLPPNAVCVTFDDGYADNVELALPVLRRWKVPATFFLTTGFLSNGCMWNDRVIEALREVDEPRLDLSKLGLGEYELTSPGARLEMVNSVLNKLKYYPRTERDGYVRDLEEFLNTQVTYTPMMGEHHITALVNAGMMVGAHTINHPILNELSPEEARHEIECGKKQLEDLIDKEVTLFAYPNGIPGKDYGDEHVDMVRRAGFSAAFSTTWAAARRADDFFQLPRVGSWEKTRLRFYLRLLKNYRITNSE